LPADALDEGREQEKRRRLMAKNIQIRQAHESDCAFLFGLMPTLAGVPRPDWHDLKAMMAFQERYISETLGAPAEDSITLIAASDDGQALGYIHAHPGKDGVTDESCGYVAIIALEQHGEGQGAAGLLMKAAEDWARGRGCRFLSLEVFATNKKAVEFYVRGGFMPETIRMVKPL